VPGCSREVPASRAAINAQSIKQGMRIHSFISFTVSVVGISKSRMKTASRTEPASEEMRFTRHTQLRSSAQIHPVNPRYSGQG